MTPGKPLDSIAADGHFGRSISSQQKGFKDTASHGSCAQVGTVGSLPPLNNPSVAAGIGPSPNSVTQLLELCPGSQHNPILEPEHFGPPTPSEADAQLMPLPMFLQRTTASHTTRPQLVRNVNVRHAGLYLTHGGRASASNRQTVKYKIACNFMTVIKHLARRK